CRSRTTAMSRGCSTASAATTSPAWSTPPRGSSPSPPRETTRARPVGVAGPGPPHDHPHTQPPRRYGATHVRYASTTTPAQAGPPSLTCAQPGCRARFTLPYGQPPVAIGRLAAAEGWTWRIDRGSSCPAPPAPARALATRVRRPTGADVTRPEGVPLVRQPALHRVQHDHLRSRRPIDDRHRRPRALAGPAPLTLTVIVPAHNEEEGLPATLESLLRQTVPADQIIVVDDGSIDRTSQVAAAYPGVTVLRPPSNLGSKAKAQNYALPYCRTRLVLPVDADTVLADDYIERVKPKFNDPKVAVAAGAVRTRFQKTIWEKGRELEYLFGFHWFRPVQHSVNAPTVCSGCCTVFDLE